MLTPTILYEDPYDHCVFQGKTPKGYVSKESDFAITSLPSEDYIADGRVNGRRVSVALRQSGVWHVEHARLDHAGGGIYVRCLDIKPRDAYAFPIDPRMKAEDIEGATDIFANAANTGWLFGHAGIGHHHDHEIMLMAGVDAIMQPLFRQYTVDYITGNNRQAKNRASNLYKLLSVFYGEVLGLARTNARAKHLGERHKETHPESGHIHSEIKAAFDSKKMEWEVDRRADATKLATAFTYITNALVIPTPETRWDKAARIAAEAEAAKKKAEAESTQTPSDGGGSSS